MSPLLEYAMKAVGSLVPTHFHNLVYRGTEGEGQRGEFLYFSLSVKMQSLAVPAREEDGGRKKKMASLHIGARAACVSLSLPPSVFLHV